MDVQGGGHGAYENNIIIVQPGQNPFNNYQMDNNIEIDQDPDALEAVHVYNANLLFVMELKEALQRMDPFMRDLARAQIQVILQRYLTGNIRQYIPAQPPPPPPPAQPVRRYAAHG